MIPPLDVFKVEQDGTLRWLEAAHTFDAAKERIAALSAKAPGEYVIYSQKTGNKTVIKTGKDQRAEG